MTPRWKTPEAEKLVSAADEMEENGDLRGAIELLSSSSLNNPWVHAHCGRLHALLDDHSNAVACFDSALRMKAQAPVTLYNRGVSLAQLGRLDDAIDDLERGIELKEDLFEAWQELGLIREFRGQLDAARAAFQKAVEHGGEEEHGWLLRSLRQREIEATFHDDDRKLPASLVLVCDYFTAHGYPISGCFELSSIGYDDLVLWFDDVRCLRCLLPFGRSSAGGVYALWLGADGTLSEETAPVVFFGSEGECSAVANNAEEFVRLLCIGAPDIGEWPIHDSDVEVNDAFVKEMEMFEVTAPRDGDAVIETARTTWETFEAWVKRNAKCS